MCNTPIDTSVVHVDQNPLDVSSVSKAATWTAYLITFCTDLLVTHRTLVNLPFKREIPDWTGGDVGVTSGHLPNHGVESSVFMHFQEVSR